MTEMEKENQMMMVASQPESDRPEQMVIKASNGLDLASPQLFTGAKQFWTSIPEMDDKRKRAALTSKLLGPADMNLSAFRDKVFEVVHMLVHNVTIAVEVEANGQKYEEYKPAARIVFLLADGRTVDTTSAGVLNSLATVFSLAGMPPWYPPLKLTMLESNTRRGRRVYSLSIVADNNDIDELLKWEE